MTAYRNLKGHRWVDLVRTGHAFNPLKSKNMQSFMNIFATLWRAAGDQ